MARETLPPAEFRPTRWSLVMRAKGSGEQARVALEELCTAYWYPLYAWARRAGLSPADAEDRVQGFFQSALEDRIFDRAESSRGRLRTFLLTAFRRSLRDERDKSGAQKRGAGQVLSFDAVQGEEWYQEDPGTESTPEAHFDRQWALTVLHSALRRLAESYAKRGMSSEIAALQPFLVESGSAEDYEREGQRIGLGAGAFKVALHRCRERFRYLLREEVAASQSDEDDLDLEISHLLRSLITTGVV